MLPEGGQKVVYLVHDEALDRDCSVNPSTAALRLAAVSIRLPRA
jgi:hypothetical protein